MKYTVFSTSLCLCIFCLILLSRNSSAADFWYEACAVPGDCGNGQKITFPFYIEGSQKPYCGHPGYQLHCSEYGHPTISFFGNNYIVENISYPSRSFRVYNYNAAVLSNPNRRCLPQIKNTTLPIAQFSYAANVTILHLLSNCTEPLSKDLWRYKVVSQCEKSNNLDLAIWDKDENWKNGLKNCETNVVVPVEVHGDEERIGMRKYEEILRRGFALNWLARNCSGCERDGGRCGFNTTTSDFSCFCPDRPHHRSCKPKRRDSGKGKLELLLLFTVIPGTGSIVVLCVVGFLVWRHKRRINDTYLLSKNISSDPSSKSDIEGGSFYYGVPVFSYTELVVASNNFDSSKELGDGGFGTVYYGKLRDGREVAIKRLYEHNYKRVEQFMNEIKILTCLRHPNLVSLYGCTSKRSRELLLVYKYVSNGTVADHIYGDKTKESPLSWPIRMNIAIETASALAYLHASDIIHRDVKTNNILLDDNFSVKVADFGLSRLFPNDVTHISTAPQGTPGYVDPEYHQCYQLTSRSDVYSFGVVLIELISSIPAVDISRHRHEINLANLAINRIQQCAFNELIDPSLGYGSDPEVTRMTTSVAELAFRCLQLETDLRPSMDEVLAFLRDIRGDTELETENKMETNENHSVSRGVKIPPSPEKDDVLLLKSKYLQSSPNVVTDKWTSESTTASSSG